MASIEEIMSAAARIAQAAATAESRTNACADELKTQSSQLAATVRGSRTGEAAVQQVNVAERTLRECASRLMTLQRTVDDFLKDISK